MAVAWGLLTPAAMDVQRPAAAGRDGIAFAALTTFAVVMYTIPSMWIEALEPLRLAFTSSVLAACLMLLRRLVKREPFYFDGTRGLALVATSFEDAAFPVSSNVTAAPVSESGEARVLLRRQLTSPVRWTELVRDLAARHPDALFVELGPGNVLAGLMKRIAPDAATATCGTPAEVETLLQRLR